MRPGVLYSVQKETKGVAPMTVKSFVESWNSDVLVYGSYATEPEFIGAVAIWGGEVKEFTSIPVLAREISRVEYPRGDDPHLYLA